MSLEQAASMTGAPASPVGLALPRARVSNHHVVLTGSLVLLLPNLLFAASLARLPGAVLTAGALGYAALSLRPAALAGSILAQPVALGRLAACLLLAATLLVLGGETHLVFANWDWLWRDAVLADLARGPMPPTYEVAGETLFLRAPLGMYMLPAAVAKLASLRAGHAVLLAQNATLLAATLYLLATFAGRRAPLVLGIVLSFSGLDVLGQLLAWYQQGGSLSAFQLHSHIEWWTQFQYSSTVTQLFWVPNHALPAYWLSVLALLCCRHDLSVADLAIAAAAALFWSPFAFIGILPFGAYLLLRDAKAVLVTGRFWIACAAGCCFLPVAVYLQIDAAAVPHAFILFQAGAAQAILQFLMIEIPHVAIIRETWRELDRSLLKLVLVAIGFLVVLPTIKVGIANDIVMRASIPALTILAVGFAQGLAAAWPARRALVGFGTVLVLLGAVTPLQEIVRALTFPSFAVSDCNLVTVWKKIGEAQPTLDNYLARRTSAPHWLLAADHGTPIVDHPGTVCWPDLTLDPNHLVSNFSNGELRRLSADPRAKRL